MNKKSIVLIICAICFGSFLFGAIAATSLNAQSGPSNTSSFTPSTFSFQKNLKQGDNNQDVRQLQIVLNSDVSTSISGPSVGSKGNESTYFGRLTANAVMRFQSKYGISATGFVGVLTRAKLNQIIQITTVSPILTNVSSSISAVVSTSSPKNKTSPHLFMLRPQQIKKGGTFALVGVDFESQNTIHIGSYVFSNVPSQDGNNISFTLPTSSTIQNGTYEVWVENTKGASNFYKYQIDLVVTDNPSQPPIISSVLPMTVSGTDTVTVTGANFASNGNDIVSSLGSIKNLSSNGTSISFPPKNLISSDFAKQIPVGKTVKIDFFITNANGVSNVINGLTLKL